MLSGCFIQSTVVSGRSSSFRYFVRLVSDISRLSRSSLSIFFVVRHCSINRVLLVIADYPSQDGGYGKQDYGKYNSQYRKIH